MGSSVLEKGKSKEMIPSPPEGTSAPFRCRCVQGKHPAAGAGMHSQEEKPGERGSADTQGFHRPPEQPSHASTAQPVADRDYQGGFSYLGEVKKV